MTAEPDEDLGPDEHDSEPPTLSAIAKAKLAADATRWEKRMHALTMRNMGAVYPAIAQALGVSEDTARNYVQIAIREIVTVPVDQMVDRQRAILLDITRQNYPTAMSPTANLDDKLACQSMLLRVLEHEAKLYGLNAPTRINVGISEQQFGAQAADLLKIVGMRPLQELAGLPAGFVETPQGHAHSVLDDGPERSMQDIEDAEVVDLPPEDEGWSNLG